MKNNLSAGEFRTEIGVPVQRSMIYPVLRTPYDGKQNHRDCDPLSSSLLMLQLEGCLVQ